MRKNLVFVFAIFFATSMSAQFYAGLGFGYGMGASERANGTEVSGTKTMNIYGSYGNGLNGTLKLGYMLNDNLGVELGASYLMGMAQVKFKSETVTEEGKSSGMRIAPQLVYQLDNGMYSRFGLIVPLFGKTVVTEKDKDYLGSGVLYESEVESVGSFSYGFVGAIGYSMELTENMKLFAELEYIGLSIKSGSAKLTKLEVDGQDQLEATPIPMKEFEFVDEIDSADTPDPDAPTKMLKQKAPFSSFGINVGIVMSF
jgi:outer membrane protein W